ncbi:MAG: MFS transporter [Thermoguttaceae bacterium]|jgi:fucose permease
MDKAVALLCVGYLGTCFSLLGATSVKLMPRLGIDKGRFGTMISIFMSVCLVASLIAGPTLDQVGYRPMALTGFSLTAVAIMLLAAANTFAGAVGACMLLGVGAIALNTAGNTLIPVVLFDGKNPAAASNLGNVFFGLGLLLTPLTAAALFRRTSYEKALLTLGALVLVPLPLVLVATFPASRASFVPAQAVALLANPVVVVAGLVLFCYFGLEASFAHWLPAFGKEVLAQARPDLESRTSDAIAQRLLSWFAVGMMLGRFLVSQIPTITKYGAWFIVGAAVLAAAIIFAMTRVRSVLQARGLSALSGLVFGLCFPTTVGVTLAQFPRDVYGTVFGVIFAIGLVGCVIVPKLIGNVARRSSIQQGMRYLLPLCVALFGLAIAMGYVKTPGPSM